MKLVDIDKLKEVLDFDAGCYYLILMARRKNNEDLTHSKEIVIRRVLYKEEMLEVMMNELLAIADYDKDHEYKLYISLNPRSVLKAYTNLKQKMATYDYEMIRNPDVIHKILKLDMEWISCLARNPAKKKFFMLDLDDKSQLNKLYQTMSIEGVEPKKEFETKNGYHILFTPCDTRDLMMSIKDVIDCELKKDDLLCVGYEE